MSVLTAIYVLIAALSLAAIKKSVDATRQQMADIRAVQAAQLNVEILQMTVTEEGEYVYANNILFKVTNVGQTAAMDVNFVAQEGGGIQLPTWGDGTNPLIAPYSKAPPIPAGQSREYRFGKILLAKKEDLAKHKWYASWYVEVAYRDVFGRAYDFQMCFLYDPRDQRYYLCPHTKQK
jgi:hypothetical protein